MFGPILLYIYVYILPLFLLVNRSPQYGEIRVRNNNVKEFAQADIWNRAVRYLHTSGEIGIDRVHDSATFAVTDGSFTGDENSYVFSLGRYFSRLYLYSVILYTWETLVIATPISHLNYIV